MLPVTCRVVPSRHSLAPSPFFRLAAAALAALTLTLPLAAEDNSWTPIPHAAAQRLPSRLVLTGDPDILYSQDSTGLLRSDDGGRHWAKVEAPIFYGDLAVDPRDPDLIFAGFYERLLRSADGGKSWAVVVTGPGRDQSKPLISRHFPGRVYALTAEAIWRSVDGGATFERRGGMPSGLISHALHEAADGGLYLESRNPCGSHGCTGWRIDRSDDQGRSWTELRSGPDRATTFNLVPHPADPAGLYFQQYTSGNTPHVFYSVDRGATAVDLGDPGFGYLATASGRPDTVYLVGRNELRRSDDRGLSFESIPLPSLPTGETELEYHDPDRLIQYWTGFQAVPPGQPLAYSSTDGGATWSPLVVEGHRPRQVSLAATSGPEGALYLESGGGLISRSRDGGATWQEFAGPRVILRLAGDPLDGNTLYLAAARDDERGIFRSRDGGESFSLVLAIGDSPLASSLVSLPRGGSTTVLAALGSGEIARSADGGSTWTVEPPAGVPASFFASIEVLIESGGTVYGVDRFGGPLYASDDGGASWWLSEPYASSADRLAGGGGLLAELLMGESAVRVRSGAAGPWQVRALPFPVTFDHYLQGDSFGNLYLAGRGLLLRSRDEGHTWQSLAQDLPDSTDRSRLLVDPRDPGQLFLAGDAGLHQARFDADPPLALQRGRFEARLRWRGSPQAPWIAGRAASVSDQSGVFHLFSADRAEVAVQVLDARPVYGRLWTFAATMTDVELELEVEDRLTGDVWRHHQPAGQLSSAAGFDAFPRALQLTGGALDLPFGGVSDPVALAPVVGSRFEVRITRLSAGAPPVPGRVLLGETAAFSFFDPAALDVLVNVIDGRALNGHFWIYAGSLTDTGFELTVRDLDTGVERAYVQSAGSFLGIRDSAAF
jgi:photosystem II stability/assembly factor-like uncharacterized protein